MKLSKMITETPLMIPSIKNDTTILAKLSLEKQKKKFENAIHLDGDWEKKIRKLTLKKVKNYYILYDVNNVLFYGLEFTRFNDGITVEWMENYSSLRGLTATIFTNILKYDNSISAIYSGDQHTPENKRLHSDFKKFKQLNVNIWDDSKKEITFENPYTGSNSIKKQFIFTLKESFLPEKEDERRTILFMSEGFELTTENIEFDLNLFTNLYFFEADDKDWW